MSFLPDFDGETYLRALDHERLAAQLLRVGHIVADGKWHTLRELSSRTGDPEASVSARLRDLRKRKFGGFTVERERLPGKDGKSGLWRYRLVREDGPPEPPPVPAIPPKPPRPHDLFSMLT